MTPRIGSLCTGYGGLDMAVQDVFGGAVAWHSQYEPPDKDGREDKNQYAAQILAHHWPKIPNHGDLTRIDFCQVEPVDILTAGFPCQDVSLAGRRAGLAEGTRSGLWLHVARAIEELQPRLVVIENVPGLLSAPADSDVEPCTWCVGDAGDEPLLRALGAVLADLARLGLDAEWGVLGASAVGAPHQRRRVILLAWPADTASAGLAWPWLLGSAAERDRAAADADGVGGERDRARGGRRHEPAPHDLPAAAEPKCPTCGCGEWMHDAGGFCAGCHGCTDPELGRPDDTAADSAGVGERESADEAHPVAGGGDAREVSGSGGSARVQWGEYEAAIRRWEHALGRPAPRPTDALGRLAPAFVEWMQGLPAGHVTDVPGIPRSAQLKALGNGVVPQQAAAAIRLLTARVETVLGVAS